MVRQDALNSMLALANNVRYVKKEGKKEHEGKLCQTLYTHIPYISQNKVLMKENNMRSGHEDINP